MRLNDLSAGAGARRVAKRAGRGMSSGNGKTAGRGHKGHKSRTGGGPPPGFEGGQMPLQRRLPKFGFASRKARFSEELRTAALEGLDGTIDLAALKAARLVGRRAKRVKIIGNEKVAKALSVEGLAVTKGARAAIEAAGGSVKVS